MLETLVPMKIPAFAAHLTDVEIMYSDKDSAGDRIICLIQTGIT